MTVYRRKRNGVKDRVFSYEFVYAGQRYRGTTGQLTKEAAQTWELKEKDRVRRVHAGLEVATPTEGIRFQEWAETFYEVMERRVSRPDRVDFLLRAVLHFWGAKPTPGPDVHIDPTGPYHDLRMTDVIRDPYWLEVFEQWMRDRGVSAQTRNHYRSICSQMYRVAAELPYRALTGVALNPFASVPRERVHGRTVTLSADDLRALLQHASYHVRLAVAIGALAPKLRLSSILALEWGKHIDQALTTITVTEHKTSHHGVRAQVYPIVAQLRGILEDARNRPGAHKRWVITYRGKPIKKIRGGVAGAAKDAGLTYGLAKNGLTFHTLRHTASTMLAEMGVDPFIHKDLMGHKRMETTAQYTHPRPPVIVEAAERLSGAFPIADLVTQPHRRATRSKAGTPVGTRARTPKKASGKTVNSPKPPSPRNPRK